MIYNGVDLSQWLITDARRNVIPPVQVSQIEIPGKDGSLLTRVQLAPLEIPVSARLKLDPKRLTVWDRQEIAETLYKREPRPLVLDDEPHIYRMAILSGSSELENLWYTGKAEITFLCPNPIGYGKKITFPVSGGTQNIRLGGNYPSKPKFTITPSRQQYLRVRNSEGDFVQVNYQFDGTETLVIDMQNCIATINGEKTSVTLNSRFFSLDSGKNSVYLSSGTGTMETHERWL